MSYQSRHELLVQVAPRYREATRKQKSLILEEFIASTGYSRKYAIRLLTLPIVPTAKKKKRGRRKLYGKDVQEALLVAWAAANYIASKRLAPFLEEFVPILEHHGHLELNAEVREQLISISPATIDRLLQPWRANHQYSGRSMTRSGQLLKHQIPVRTFADWEERLPGFFEADLVAHCGCSVAGAFLYTLVLVGIATGWVECLALLHRSKDAVIDALERVRRLLPFPMLGLDTDNGSEFINSALIEYCEQEHITFTRGRAYKKNDQCFVEQKNGAIVRQFVGYDRFEGYKAYQQLTELYRAIRPYNNYFQPSMKLQQKTRVSSTVHKTYDRARTPLQRLRESGILKEETAQEFQELHRALDPVALLKQIQVLQDALWQHAVVPAAPLPSETQSSDSEDDTRLSSAEGGCSENLPGTASEPGLIDAGVNRTRRYRRKSKAKTPRWWRTRQDPFEEVWSEIATWLEQRPESTAKSLLVELQERYPGKHPDSQLRTLQRRVQAWRARTIIVFHETCMQEDGLKTES
jgi:hypothetical protein